MKFDDFGNLVDKNTTFSHIFFGHNYIVSYNEASNSCMATIYMSKCSTMYV